jgi:hypothetical protein
LVCLIDFCVSPFDFTATVRDISVAHPLPWPATPPICSPISSLYSCNSQSNFKFKPITITINPNQTRAQFPHSNHEAITSQSQPLLTIPSSTEHHHEHALPLLCIPSHQQHRTNSEHQFTTSPKP